MENPIQILLRSIVSNEVDEEELRRTAQCTLELQQVPKDASLTIVISRGQLSSARVVVRTMRAPATSILSASFRSRSARAARRIVSGNVNEQVTASSPLATASAR